MGVDVDKIAEAYDVEVGNGMPTKNGADTPPPKQKRTRLLVRVSSEVPQR